MIPREAEALRQRAAQAVFDRIRRDIASASPRVRPMLEHIEANLFDPELTYLRLRAALGIRDHNRTTAFRRETSLTPAAYVRECRYEVASILLRRTTIEVGRIAELVGVGGLPVFTPSFKRWAGVTPTSLRASSKRTGENREPLTLPATEIGPAAWRRLAAGELPEEEAEAYQRRFLCLYPAVRRKLVEELLAKLRAGYGAGDRPAGRSELLPALEDILERVEVERLMAATIWTDLCELELDAQVDLIRSQRLFRTPALVELLGTRYVEAGRANAQRGVEIARLAIEAAGQLERGGRGSGPSRYTALSWMWLGNAKRIAGDPMGAEQALATAEPWLPKDPVEPDELAVVAEFHELRATLWLYEARYAEAMTASQRALPLYRLIGEPHAIAKALMIRSRIEYEVESFSQALAGLEEALAILRQAPNDYLLCVATFEVARCHFDQGDLARAAAALAEARQLAAALPESGTAWAMTWLEGRIAAKEGRKVAAAECLEATVSSLESCGKDGQLAVALLDLALLRADEGQLGEVSRMCGKALVAFESTRLTREAAVARELLAGAVASSTFDVATLEVAQARIVEALGSGRRI